MKNNSILKTNLIWCFVAIVIFGGAISLRAFTEPTSSPTSQISYPPVNVGPTEQVVSGQIGIWDGSGTSADANSFFNDGTIPRLGSTNSYIKGQAGFDSLFVEKSAVLRQNITIGTPSLPKTFFNMGLLRIGKLVIGKGTPSTTDNYDLEFPLNSITDSNNFGQYNGTFNVSSNTNLGIGNKCKMSIGTSSTYPYSLNTACPNGFFLQSIDFSANTAICQEIGPRKNPGISGDPCTTFTP